VDQTAAPGDKYHYQVTASVPGKQIKSKVVQAGVVKLDRKVKGFNVYRSRNLDGPFYQINPLPVTGDTYIDGDLPADSGFFYKVSVVYDAELPGHVDLELNTKMELAFWWTKWGKTKKAKPTKVSLAVHPCAHGKVFNKVRLVARVYDQKGDIVKGLKAKNFKVTVDGKAAPVKLFWANYPWGMQMGGVVMDYSGSMYATKRDIPLMENMLISGMVGAKAFWDRYNVIKYDTKIETYVPFTTSLKTLLKGIKALNHKFSGATAFYDAAIATLAAVNKQKHPIPLLTSLFHKKFVVGFTDGEENSSKHKAAEVLHAAQQACAPFFAVGFDGQIDSKGIKKLIYLTSQTGGATFIAGKNSSGLFEKVSKLVDNGYSLVINKTPGAPAVHKVTIELKYKGLKDSYSTGILY